MAHQAQLKYIFYIAATPEKVWEGFVSRESNRIIFSGAELHADFKLGGLIASVGAGLDGKALKALRRGEMRGYDIAEYIHETSEEVLRVESSRTTGLCPWRA